MSKKLRFLETYNGSIGLVSRVFDNGPGDQVSIPGRVILDTQKMIFAISLFNTQRNKVISRVKWSNPRKGVVPSPTPGVVAIEKGAFGLLSTSVTNFTFTYNGLID